MNAGLAIERVDLEPRVVGDRGQAAVLCRIAGLEDRVFDERQARFLRLRRVPVRLWTHLHAQGFQEPVELAQLSGVAGCDDPLPQ